MGVACFAHDMLMLKDLGEKWRTNAHNMVQGKNLAVYNNLEFCAGAHFLMCAHAFL